MKSRRSDFITRAVLSIAGTYVVLIGGTSTGALDPLIERVSLILMAGLVIGWLLVRRSQRWTWHHTFIDGAFVLWWVAIGLSLLANQDSWRRIAIGMWYIGLYTGLWFILHDALSNRWLRREVLIESLLMAGSVALFFGYAQVFSWTAGWFNPPGLGEAPILGVPRITGTLENPNIMSSLLVVLVSLAVGYFATVRNGLARVLLAIYAVLASFLLLLTFGRGGWLGAASGLVVLVILLLADRRSLSATRLRQGWRAQSRWRKAALLTSASLIVVGSAALSLVFIQSFSEGGRGLDLRTYIYDAAIQMFREKPVTGYGLFTFGRGLLRLSSTPPYQIHNQAHDAPLNIAAEMGLFGLLALVVTVGASLRAMKKNWQATSGRGRMALIGPIAAVVGLAVNHLTDIPSIVPVIFLIGLVSLSAAAAPFEVAIVSSRQRGLRFIMSFGLWVVILGVGFWNNRLYSGYTAAMEYGRATEDYRGAALRIQPIIDSDPNMAIYHFTQGYFLAKAAYAGDRAAITESLAAYQRFLALEPDYALGWANLSALYWQAGQPQQAIQAMQENALRLAPRSWEIAANLGAYKEATGDREGARQAYKTALANYPAAVTSPAWLETALRRELIDLKTIDFIPYRTVVLIDMGLPAEAREVWKSASPAERADSSGHLIDLVLDIETGDLDAARAEFAAIKAVEANPAESTWMRLANGYLAYVSGDSATVSQELETVDRLMATARLYRLNDLYTGISHIQYFCVGPSEYLLPQLPILPADPIVASLSAHLEHLAQGEWL